MSADDAAGSQSYVPFSLPKDPDCADDATKYVYPVLCYRRLVSETCAWIYCVVHGLGWSRPTVNLTELFYFSHITHTCHFNGHFPDKPGLASCPLELTCIFVLMHPLKTIYNFPYSWHIPTRSSLGILPSSSIVLQCHTVFNPVFISITLNMSKLSESSDSLAQFPATFWSLHFSSCLPMLKWHDKW